MRMRAFYQCSNRKERLQSMTATSVKGDKTKSVYKGTSATIRNPVAGNIIEQIERTVGRAAAKLQVNSDKTGHRIVLAKLWSYPIFQIGAGRDDG
jgi:hypothetical protein